MAAVSSGVGVFVGVGVGVGVGDGVGVFVGVGVSVGVGDGVDVFVGVGVSVGVGDGGDVCVGVGVSVGVGDGVGVWVGGALSGAVGARARFGAAEEGSTVRVGDGAGEVGPGAIVVDAIRGSDIGVGVLARGGADSPQANSSTMTPAKGYFPKPVGLGRRIQADPLHGKINWRRGRH